MQTWAFCLLRLIGGQNTKELLKAAKTSFLLAYTVHIPCQIFFCMFSMRYDFTSLLAAEILLTLRMNLQIAKWIKTLCRRANPAPQLGFKQDSQSTQAAMSPIVQRIGSGQLCLRFTTPTAFESGCGRQQGQMT